MESTEQPRDTVLYLHRKESDGSVFYVGIGTSERPYVEKGRSTIWKRTVAKHGRTVQVIATDLTWDKACFLEVSAIHLFGRRDLRQGALVNLTDGGEGTRGMVLSEEARAKMSAAKKASLANPEFREKWSAARTLPADQIKLGACMYANRLPKAGTKNAQLWSFLEQVIADTGKMPLVNEFDRMAKAKGLGTKGMCVHGHYRAHQAWLASQAAQAANNPQALEVA